MERVRLQSRDTLAGYRVMDLAEVRANGDRILDEIGHAVVGKRDVLELMLMGLLADGHVLLEDVPGLAKTLAARSFAARDGRSASPACSSPPICSRRT